MMRSLFSGVAGLKTHQTRMDVIGNNIANVNTTAYKSQSMVFSDLLYQTTQSASGANAATGRGGINPRQIGLGSKTGAISTAITQQGSAQSTNNPFDIMITGESFFIVSNGSQNFFTRDGSFTVDGAGNLVMSTTGYKVMGWQVDPETGDIKADTVSALQIMSEKNLVADPEATSKAYVAGILDKYDTNVNSTSGKIMTLSFYDNLGYAYTAKFSIHSKGAEGMYRVQLDDIIDSDGVSLVERYNLSDISQIANFGSVQNKETTSMYNLIEGASCKTNGTALEYSLAYSPEDFLEGLSTDPLIASAKANGSWEVDSATAGVTAGQDVKVKGTATISKAILEAEPYNLIYNSTSGLYYKDANGNQVADIGEEVNDLTKWKAALGLDALTAVPTVDTADGSIAITFEKTFKASDAGTYNSTSKKFETPLTGDDILKAYGLENTADTTYRIEYATPDDASTTGVDESGKYAQITKIENNKGFELVFDVDNGHFSYIDGPNNDTVTLAFNGAASSLTGENVSLTHFSNIDIDFSSCNMFNNGGTSTIGATSGAGDENNTGSGRKRGEMIGVEVGQDGRITASYDNGMTKLLGQISVANFANASGLAKAGDNLYSATMNSGEFDGVGVDITSGDGSMTSGVLEMSNVDLSSEFTTMITTQRGFQANSRIISVSDTMLEELVNLKR
ncbi:MAG: flagellar hook protein FlgE [Lachnospiraceae bacterium]